jgi:hypothetical protein
VRWVTESLEALQQHGYCLSGAAVGLCRIELL